jgi:hypothetical protein
VDSAAEPLASFKEVDWHPLVGFLAELAALSEGAEYICPSVIPRRINNVQSFDMILGRINHCSHWRRRTSFLSRNSQDPMMYRTYAAASVASG